MTARSLVRATALTLPLAILLFATLIGLAPSAFAEEPVDAEAQAAELIALFKDKDPSVRVKALEKAVGNQESSLLSPLQRLTTDRELGVRLGAIEALAARTDKSARKKAAATLSTRLTRLSKTRADQDELFLVIQSLGSLAQPVAIKPLIDPISTEMDMDEVKARLQAVANIPDEKTVEALIDFLAKGRRSGRGPLRKQAHDALRYLTGGSPKEHRTAGHDADRWRAWWKDNKKSIDLEAIVTARAEAEAEKQARAEKKKKQAEDRKKKREERKRKKRQKPAPTKPPVVD